MPKLKRIQVYHDQTCANLASCGDMETLPNKREPGGHNQTLTNKRQRRSDSPPPAGSRWLLLPNCIDDEGSDGSSSVANAKSAAACCNSSGKPFCISFGIAAPPALCSLHFDWLCGGTPSDGDGKHPKPQPNDVQVIAGHDDAVLIQMRWVSNPKASEITETFDYFLYEAGGGARPPSLSLLPGCFIQTQFDRRNPTRRDRAPKTRQLTMENTGMLRRGGDDGDLVVCQYDMVWDHPVKDMAELCMLHIGRGREWTNRRLRIEFTEESRELQPREHRRYGLNAEAVVPVGDRFLCWVHYSNGFIVCDMADEERPKLRYVPLPVEATQRDAYWIDDSDLRRCRTLGAAGADTVRFVSVAPPPVPTDGRLWNRSSSNFKVKIWTMTLGTEAATTWVKDVVLNCDVIWKWQLPNYERLPHDKRFEYPMVRCDEPDIISFRVDGMALQINTGSKKLLSVIPSETKDKDEEGHQRQTRRERDISITAKLGW